MKMITLSELMAENVPSINPAQFPEETFELWSIPAYDVGEPEIAKSNSIGSAKKCIVPGDVLLSRIVPHIRRSWIVAPNSNGLRQIASGEWIVFRSQKFKPRYLRHVLISDDFHAKFMNTVAGVGGSLLRARPDGVRAIEIPFPSLPEQERIAEILDQADELRRTQNSALKRLSVLEAATFYQMFGDPISNTKGFSARLLGDIAQIERGKFTPRPRNDPSYYNGQYPFIQTGDISQSNGRLRLWSQTLNEKGIAVSRSFPPGTVVIAIVGATLGMTSILDIEVYCPDSVIGIQVSQNEATPEYVERLLRIWRPIFVSQAPDTARANMNLESLRPLKIPVPDIDLQRRFSRYVRQIESVRSAYTASLRRLDSLFSSLQHRAFNGELTAKTAERELAEAV